MRRTKSGRHRHAALFQPRIPDCLFTIAFGKLLLMLPFAARDAKRAPLGGRPDCRGLRRTCRVWSFAIRQPVGRALSSTLFCRCGAWLPKRFPMRGIRRKKRSDAAERHTGNNYGWLIGEEDDMKSILLIGLGRFGRHIAIKLDELHHQVLAVDREEQRVNDVLPYVTSAQIGDATNREFLESLGVRNFDVCIVAIGDDFQSSLETTSLLKELGAGMVVSRAARDVHAKFLLRNGADEIVYPEEQLAAWTAIRYSADHIFDYIELDEEHAIYEISIPQAWAGKTVGQLDIRKKYNINIMALKHRGALDLNIRSDTCLQGSDTMLVLGGMKDIQKCFHI